jgi:hypothetical protein
MPKDTLKQLDRDVDRMLFAGAQIARTDPNLLSAKDKLAPLAARAPALGKVAEQIDKLHKSTGKQAAVELLGLASLMAQVRGAQAARRRLRRRRRSEASSRRYPPRRGSARRSRRRSSMRSSPR